MVYSQKVYNFFGKEKNTYFNYLSLNSKTAAIVGCISSGLNTLNFRRCCGTRETLSILCIGGGSGDTDLTVINNLKKKNVLIHNIDPSIEMMDLFQKRAEKLGLKNKIHHLDLARFESDSYIPPKSDIVLCLSSVYFLEGWGVMGTKNPLLKIYSALNENGVAAIVLKSDKSDHCLVKKSGNGGKTCGKDIRRILRKLHIPHYWEIISSHIDLSSCFENGNFNPKKQGIDLLSFMFKGDWNIFSSSKKNEIIKMLKKKTFLLDGKRVLKANYECIWIVKSKADFSNKSEVDVLTDQSTAFLVSKLKERIRSFEDFPKKGIDFKDMTPILRDPRVFGEIINYVEDKYHHQKIDFVAAKDMQGLIWAGAIALKLGVGIIPMFRKDLPGELLSAIYSHEYNSNRVLNLQKEAIKPGQRVLIVDYIIATGETVRNMIRLIEHLGGEVAGIFSVAELTSLRGRKDLNDYNIHSIVKY